MKVFTKQVEKNLKPKISLILLDWSVRESFHILKYLNEQTIERDGYEIIWIEYYSRQPTQVLPPAVDKLIVLEIPEDTYYHKHLMYNTGFIAAQGDIIVICDSDVMVKPTFVQSIVEEFQKNSHIVLHLDEVRNKNKRFYPFNYPSFKELLGEGCINWKNGKTTGLRARWDTLHTRNYGACFCARREDLIAIGGADEHTDYLGHICGPYELTFRLKNAGKKEIWHPSEFLYHTWHPGTDGIDNYLGPHDGKNMSLAALAVLKTKRVRPLVENQAIALLCAEKNGDRLYAPLLECVIPVRDIEKWKVGRLSKAPVSTAPGSRVGLRRTLRRMMSIRYWLNRLNLLRILVKILASQIRAKATAGVKTPVMRKNIYEKFLFGFKFAGRMWKNNLYLAGACEQTVQNLIYDGVEEVAVFGKGAVADIFNTARSLTQLKLFGIFDDSSKNSLKDFNGIVAVASVGDHTSVMRTLETIGIRKDRIVTLR